MNDDLPKHKDALRDLITSFLKQAGIEDFEIKSLHLDIARRQRSCPPGKQLVWEAVRQPDGSVVFQYVCK